ncbi:hypothetical protein JTB14_027592 [Gonioctena quinquepunctata]|nr:hypothetical protein JTB14_027592 [Gonioctena quinquepunctata]
MDMPTDVSGELEVDMNVSEDDCGFEHEDEWDDEDNIPLSNLVQKSAEKQKTAEPNWTRTSVNMNIEGTDGTGI